MPHLTFRVANWRHNLVTEAQLRVILLVSEQTREGETLRRQIEVPLVRDNTPLFALTWTVLHLVDGRSPFFGADALSRLRAASAEIYVTLTGLDEAMGQIHAQHSYRLDDIVTNMRFVDVLKVRPDGTRELDYRHFHDVVPLAPEHWLAIDTGFWQYDAAMNQTRLAPVLALAVVTTLSAACGCGSGNSSGGSGGAGMGGSTGGGTERQRRRLQRLSRRAPIWSPRRRPATPW